MGELGGAHGHLTFPQRPVSLWAWLAGFHLLALDSFLARRECCPAPTAAWAPRGCGSEEAWLLGRPRLHRGPGPGGVPCCAHTVRAWGGAPRPGPSRRRGCPAARSLAEPPLRRAESARLPTPSARRGEEDSPLSVRRRRRVEQSAGSERRKVTTPHGERRGALAARAPVPAPRGQQTVGTALSQCSGTTASAGQRKRRVGTRPADLAQLLSAAPPGPPTRRHDSRPLSPPQCERRSCVLKGRPWSRWRARSQPGLGKSL